MTCLVLYKESHSFRLAITEAEAGIIMKEDGRIRVWKACDRCRVKKIKVLSPPWPPSRPVYQHLQTEIVIGTNT